MIANAVFVATLIFLALGFWSRASCVPHPVACSHSAHLHRDHHALLRSALHQHPRTHHLDRAQVFPAGHRPQAQALRSGDPYRQERVVGEILSRFSDQEEQL